MTIFACSIQPQTDEPERLVAWPLTPRGREHLPAMLDLRTVAKAAWWLKHPQGELVAQTAEERQIVSSLEIVLRANIMSGRYELARSYRIGLGDEGLDLQRYAAQVITFLESELGLIEGLKAGERARWTVVLTALEKRAERWLGRYSPWQRADPAEVAGHTCMDLWTALHRRSYPFDVPFDRWSARALLNRMRQAVRDAQIRDRHITDSLDRSIQESPIDLTVGEVTADGSSTDWTDRMADRDMLWQALGNIEPHYAEILVLLYLDEMPVKEVAQTLGLNRNYVYQLRGRSLVAMRQAWESLLETPASQR